jgi:U6 snRNA phosphodiesterase
MALVQYPESDSDDDDQTHAVEAQQVESPPKSALKRKHSEAAQDDLPPLPAAFHDLYTTNARISTSDNPSLHGGRKRAVPHVEGNWPSHVYLECKDATVWP